MTKPPKTGTFLGVPYDWRWPTVARAEVALVKPGRPAAVHAEDVRWGFDINLARLAAGLMRELTLMPSFHLQVAYKANWHEIGDDAPQFAENN